MQKQGTMRQVILPLEGDISQELALDNATAIICNLVLQFIDPKKRTACIQDYFNTLPNGGQLIIVEKVHQEIQNCKPCINGITTH